MLISDAAPKGLIFELSALHDYYYQTYVLLIFLTREFLALQALDRMIFSF